VKDKNEAAGTRERRENREAKEREKRPKKRKQMIKTEMRTRTKRERESTGIGSLDPGVT